MTPDDAAFNALMGVLVIPGVAAVLLAALPNYRATARLNVAATTLTLLCALSLFFAKPAPGAYFLVDDLNNTFIVLTTFVGWTTSIFSASYIGHEIDIGRLTPRSVRFYHAMYQILMFAMNLALIANNIGLMWVAIEIATLTTVMMVGIYRTHEALEAAWKYFILGSVGIALALFGTILVYMAARPIVGEGLNAMVWSVLVTRAGSFDPALLDVAFVFLLLGYGTKVGLAPLHAWLPDAHAEGPTPISAVLSGLLLNVALYALLRFKMLLAVNTAALAPGPLMVALGLLSLVFAAFMLYRRRDIKRLFAYSSIEHMGIITFAFGMGGPLANFAGLLHMTMHSLTKSAIFFAVGHVAQVKGTQRISDMSGLTVTHPLLGWGLILGVIAIAGLPPLGIFMSEFLVVSSTFARTPLLALILVFGILVGFRRLVAAPQQHRLRRAARPGRQGAGLLCADVHPLGAGARRRHLHAAGARCLVSACRRIARLDRWPHSPTSLAGQASRRSSPVAALDRDGRHLARCGERNRRRPRHAAWAVGRRGRFVRRTHGDHAAKPRTTLRLRPSNVRTERSLRSARCTRLLSASNARFKVFTAYGRSARRMRGHGSISAFGTCSIRSASASRRRMCAPPMPFCRRKARACIRFPSARCMPASSSRDTSASPPRARRSCGSNNVSATCTRASSR